MYLSFGALIALVGFDRALRPMPAGARTFDIPELIASTSQGQPISTAASNDLPAADVRLRHSGLFVAVSHMGAIGVWRAAPTATAMLHAGVLKKFGLYGLIRMALARCCRTRAEAGCRSWPALPRQHPLLRSGGHAPARPQSAHRQLQRGPHGLRVPRRRQA